MSVFADAVAELQPRFADMPDQQLAAYITAPERLPEAAAVDGCVQRAVAGELDPTGYLAISRYTPLSPPGLAELLMRKRKYNPDNADQQEIVATSVRKTIALAWLYSCHPDAAIADHRTERDIWAAWAASLREPLKQVIQPKLARIVLDAGSDLLVDELKRGGMARWLGGSKLGQVGYHLAQGGYYLRLTQTEELPEENFDRALKIHEEMVEGNPEGRGRWAWDAYTVD
jgi:hypothetical protein